MSEKVEYEAFTIDNDQKAEWAIRRIMEARKDAEVWEKFYKDAMLKVRKQAEETEAYMTSLLQAYFCTVPHKRTKTQESYALPSGKLVIKAQQPKYSVDDAAACAWLSDSNMEDYIKIEKRVDWVQLKKSVSVLDDGSVMLNGTGELINGITAEIREPSFVVDIKD